MPFDTVPAAIRDVASGKLVIVADDEDRENEGDLVCAADLITPDLVNFMTRHGRGLICVVLSRERLGPVTAMDAGGRRQRCGRVAG